MPTAVRTHIRWMIRRDMDEVLAIEDMGEASWGIDEFLACLAQRNCIGMVCEHGDKVIGFHIYELKMNKLTLLKFGVHTQWRRLGIGRQMVEKLVGNLTKHRRTRVVVDVGERNMAALMFFKACGFRATKLIRDEYEDVVRMRYEFGTS